MYSQTVTALTQLTSMYVVAIEGTATKIPDEIVELIATDPFKACESLNDFALSCNAVTPEFDAELEAIYESMDADDARSNPEPEVCQAALGAYASVHVDIPEPEPEPEVPAEPVEQPSDESTEQTEESASEKPRKRRQRRQRKTAPEERAAQESVEPAQDESAQPEPEPEAASAEAPKKKRASKKSAPAETPEEQSAKKSAAKQGAKAFEGEVFSVDQALAILGCSRPKLTKLIESGEIPAFKKGRAWQVSANAVLDRAAQK